MPFFKIPLGCHAQTFVFIGPSDWPECVFSAAKEKNDIRMCKHAGILWYYCINTIAGTTLSKCDSLKNNYYQRKDYCISQVAQNQKNISLCSQAGESQRGCYWHFGTKDLDTCLALNHTGAKDGCLRYFGPKLKNSTLCSDITDPRLRYGCFEKSGIIKHSTCLDIENKDHKDDCLENAGINSKNISICKMVDNKFGREICLREVAIALEDVLICSHIETDYARNYCTSHFN